MNSNILKTINYIKRNGLVKTYYAVKERLDEKSKPPYAFDPISQEELAHQKALSSEWSTNFSILVPAYETGEKYMTELVNTLLGQSYGKWELIIADASKSNVVKDTINKFDDSRIHYIKLEKNAGISANTNEGLKYCNNEYVGLLDHDDLLTYDALYEMASLIESKKAEGVIPELVYSDEDKTDGDNTCYFDPNIKPEFNYDLLLSNNYICHFCCFKKETLDMLKFRESFDGAQDHDVLLRLAAYLMNGSDMDKKIYHIQRVLYHWRCHEASTAANPKSKEYAYIAGKRAVEDHLQSRGIKCKVSELPHMGFFYTSYEPDIFSNRPLVGAVGGRVIDQRKNVVDGVYDDNMNVLFEGSNVHSSGGILHRAACQMEVAYVDVRSMIPSDEGILVLNKLMKETGNNKRDNSFAGYDEEYWRNINKRFGDLMHKKGYIFVYDPKLVVRKKDLI